MRKKRTKIPKEIAAADARKIIEGHIANESEHLNYKNFRKDTILKLKPPEASFRFTVDLLSLDLLISLMEEPSIKNVLFNPSTPPPGGSTDSISLRYKIYVIFYPS